jgi:hypothetical protein
VNGEAGDVVAPGRLPHKTWEVEQGEGSHDAAPAVAAVWLGRAIFPKAPTGWLTGIGVLPGGVLGMPVPVQACEDRLPRVQYVGLSRAHVVYYE